MSATLSTFVCFRGRKKGGTSAVGLRYNSPADSFQLRESWGICSKLVNLAHRIALQPAVLQEPFLSAPCTPQVYAAQASAVVKSRSKRSLGVCSYFVPWCSIVCIRAIPTAAPGCHPSLISPRGEGWVTFSGKDLYISCCCRQCRDIQ